MIQLKNDFSHPAIQQAAHANSSEYGGVNRYAQQAYQNLQDTYDKISNAYQPAYEAYQQAIEASVNAAVNAYGQQKKDAKDAYLSARNAAETSYKKADNFSGATSSNLYHSGLQDSGYAQVQKARAFTQKQQQLMQANTKLQQALTALDNQITQARLQGDEQKAQLLMQQAQQGVELQQYLDSTLSSIASQLQSMNQTERSFAYTKQQDSIANDLAKKNFQLSKDQFAWQKAKG